jgi:hypothetical protein
MIKITGQTETMFAQAVALAQSGRMKSTIHINGGEIFILNMDNTILIKFESPQVFPEAISFYANDYESPEMGVENGQVYFHQYTGEYKRKKLCPKPNENFGDLKTLWDNYTFKKDRTLSVHKDITALLDDGLSHIEFTNVPGGISLIQKNIYDGSRVEINKKTTGRGFMSEGVPVECLPLGIRTADFNALFALVDEIVFYFQPDRNYLHFSDTNGIVNGVLASCLYDELGYLKEK